MIMAIVQHQVMWQHAWGREVSHEDTIQAMRGLGLPKQSLLLSRRTSVFTIRIDY